MSNLPAVGSAIHSRLSGASAVNSLVSTRIYRLQAPAGTAKPYIAYYRASGLMPNQTPRDDVNWVYRVEAVADTNASAENVADAIYGALHEQSLTLTDWTAYWMACESVVEFVDTFEGRQEWRHIVDVRIKADKN